MVEHFKSNLHDSIQRGLIAWIEPHWKPLPWWRKLLRKIMGFRY